MKNSMLFSILVFLAFSCTKIEDPCDPLTCEYYLWSFYSCDGGRTFQNVACDTVLMTNTNSCEIGEIVESAKVAARQDSVTAKFNDTHPVCKCW